MSLLQLECILPGVRILLANCTNISATSETLSYCDHYFWRSFHGQRRRNANNDISLSPWKQNLTRNRFNKNPRAFIFSTSCRPRHKLGALLSRGSHVPQSCLSISKIANMKYWLASFVHFWCNVICKMLFIVGMIYSSSSGCWACLKNWEAIMCWIGKAITTPYTLPQIAKSRPVSLHLFF